MTTRRDILLAALAAGFASRTAAASTGPLYLSARGEGGRDYFATGFDAGGRLAFDLRLPARGHAFAVSPSGHAVLFGRRPGAFAMVIDPRAGRVVRQVDVAADRWFNGHGAFGADGRLLYATETVASTGQGVVGVYDGTAGYRRIGEFASQGLDPHEIRLLPDGRTLAVANGGLMTDADAPRLKLNVETMRPSLVYLEARTGHPLQQVEPPAALHQLSVRHLTLAADGRVLVAMQYEGPKGDIVPLIAAHKPGARDLVMLDLSDDVLDSLKGYCGSAAVDEAGRVLAVSSPRGGRILFWDLAADRFIRELRLDDGCGIAPRGNGLFLLSAGTGIVLEYDVSMGRRRRVSVAGPPAPQWDNHIAMLA